MSFFFLTLLFSLPFYGFGFLMPVEILPGLPISALMVICPTLAAVLLTALRQGRAGVRKLLRIEGCLHGRPLIIPFMIALLTKPLIFAASFCILVLQRVPIPASSLNLVSASGLLLLFLLSAFAEELGWMRYAYERLESKARILAAGILIGLFSAGWHVIPFMQAGHPVSWIAWQSLYLVASRILTVWVYRRSGRSLWIATLFHAMGNLSWQLFPVHGSLYDPRITSIITAVTCVLILVLRSGSSRNTCPDVEIA